MMGVANTHSVLPHIIPMCIMLHRRGRGVLWHILQLCLQVVSLSRDCLTSSPEQLHQNKTTKKRTKKPTPEHTNS